MSESDATQDLNALLTHADGLRALVRSLLRDEAQVDDVLQETWLIASRQRASIDGAWLRQVARRLVFREARSAERRRRREASVSREEMDGAIDPATLHEREELRRRIADAVFQLPEPYRVPLVLRYFEGQDGQEIAKACGLSAVAVRTRIHRGLSMLRERLDRETFGGREAWRAQFLPLVGTHFVPKGAVGGGSLLIWSMGVVMLITAMSTLAAFTLGWFEPGDLAHARSTPAFVDSAVSDPEARSAETAQVTRALIERIERDPEAFAAWSGRRTQEPLEVATTGVLEGKVLDADGTAVVSGWTVRWMPSPVAAEDPISVEFLAAENVGEGRFRLEDVPVGRAAVWASFENGVRTEPVTVVIEEGRTTTLALRAPTPLGKVVAIKLRTERQPAFDALLAEPPTGARLVEAPASEAVWSLGPRLVVHFENVEPGKYTFQMRDPRFAPIDVEGLEPGGRVSSVILRGSSSVRLLVHDATTGEAVPRYRVYKLEDGESIGAPRVLARVPARRNPEPVGQVLVDGLLPGDARFRIVADGHADQDVAIAGLEAAEARSVQVHLFAMPTITGIVRDASGRAVPGARVGVFDRAQRDDSDDSLHFTRGMRLEGVDDAEVRWERTATQTDSEGRFVFRNLPPGDYALRATTPDLQGSHLPEGLPGNARVSVSGYTSAKSLRRVREPSPSWPYAPHVVAAFGLLHVVAGGSSAVELSFGETATLGGTIRGHAAHLEGGKGWLRAFDGTGRGAKLVAQVQVVDDRFRFRWLPITELQIQFVWERVDPLSSGGTIVTYGGHEDDPIALGAVRLTPGEERLVTFDLRQRTPRDLQVQLRIAGADATTGARILFRSCDGLEHGDVHVAAIDANGQGRFERLLPGRYDVAVVDVRGLWFHALPIVDVPQEPVSLTDFVVHLNEVTWTWIDDASNAPLRETRVHIEPVPSWGADVGWTLTTDVAGVTKLALPAGSYELHVPGPNGALPETRVRVEVRSEARSAPATVRWTR